MTGIELIAAERKRQIEEEGWSLERDQLHADEELATAAACYALPKAFRGISKRIGWDEATWLMETWPWSHHWWKPGDRIRELSKAGALIAAELDRLLAGAAP